MPLVFGTKLGGTYTLDIYNYGVLLDIWTQKGARQHKVKLKDLMSIMTSKVTELNYRWMMRGSVVNPLPLQEGVRIRV